MEFPHLTISFCCLVDTMGVEPKSAAASTLVRFLPYCEAATSPYCVPEYRTHTRRGMESLERVSCTPHTCSLQDHDNIPRKLRRDGLWVCRNSYKVASCNFRFVVLHSNLNQLDPIPVALLK
jgi:hypothetical protein